MSSSPRKPPPQSAESLFAEWLGDGAPGGSRDIEELCRAHPELERRLRELHQDWARLATLLPRGRLSGSLAERLRTLHGSDVDPRIELEHEGGESFTTELLSRLTERTPSTTRYRLKGEVGQGGMGVVLRVWDEDLRRHLAMKLLLADRTRSAAGGAGLVAKRKLARFLEEAQITGQLDHPGIVPVHELALDAEGRVFFTMKLVRGKTLAEVFDELAAGAGGWTQTRVLASLLKVCEAMSYAHAKGVIHRDLKPTNVMIGRFGEVYVMDWGLARVLGRPDEKDLRLREPVALTSEVVSERRAHEDQRPDAALYTLDGDVVGTPAYMPPEQAAGHVAELGPGSDVYAVGAMLYHLLAGQMPYVPPGARVSPYALLVRVQEGPPRPLRELAADAPSELTAICEKAMARRIEERYPDMRALAEDLTAYVEGRVVRAYETGTWAETKKWLRRNKPLAASLAAAFALLVAGLVAAVLLRAEAVANFALAEERRQEAEANERLAKQNEAEAERQAALAAEQARIATARAEDVVRHGALLRLRTLSPEAGELWPPHPEKIPALRDWLRQAEALVADLPRHREMREDLRAQAVPDEEIEARVPTKLIEGLEELSEPERGLLSANGISPEHGWSVPRRLAFAERLEAGFAPGGEFDRRWQAALPDIHSAYPGLELGPQMGLVPIGSDPESGLWEFWHLATGAEPERGSDGRLALTEDSAVVLVLVPGGTFRMGAQREDPSGQNYDPDARDSESPVHEVTLSPYFLSKFELTQGQWQRITGRNPSAFGEEARTLLHPLEFVSWLDHRQWLPRLGLALPSEAQWEHGCRAGTNTPWWTGSQRESLQEKGAANLADQSARRAGHEWPKIADWPELEDGYALHAPVGSFAANPFGLHDVHGNVWEWCADGYDAEFYAAGRRTDPLAPPESAVKRVCRGGAYNGTAADARSAHRGTSSPTFQGYFLGVRPARGVER